MWKYETDKHLADTGILRNTKIIFIGQLEFNKPLSNLTEGKRVT